MIRSLVTRVGPRPVLLTRYVLHKLRERLLQKRLRGSYERLVVRAPGGELRLTALDLPSGADLPPELERAAEALRAEAELILQGRVDFLGSGFVALGREIDWHRDFKSGYRWSPTTFYQDLE